MPHILLASFLFHKLRFCDPPQWILITLKHWVWILKGAIWILRGAVLQMALGKMAHGRSQCWQSLDAEAQMPR